MKAVCVLLVFGAAASGQVAREANRDYETPEARKRMIERLESPARLANLRPAELVRRLDVRPGSTVVDLGTGTGNLLAALSRAVGPKGQVIAEDIHADFLERARERAQKDGLANIRYIKGSEQDPNLPAGAADLVVVVDAYHHFDFPQKMLAAITRALRPDGRLAILEYHRKRGAMEGDPEFAIQHIRAGAEQVVEEIEKAGFKLVSQQDFVPDRQYLAIFKRR